MNSPPLPLKALTREAFAPFGDVIEMNGAEHFAINQGTTERYHDLANVDISQDDGKAIISIFRGQPRPRPIMLVQMERHPLASQAFYPLQERDWFVVVAGEGDPLSPENLHAFRANGRQGASETGYGQVRRDAQTGKIELVDIQYFPAEEVNAPEGTGVLDWINSGFA